MRYPIFFKWYSDAWHWILAFIRSLLIHFFDFWENLWIIVINKDFWLLTWVLISCILDHNLNIFKFQLKQIHTVTNLKPVNNNCTSSIHHFVFFQICSWHTTSKFLFIHDNPFCYLLTSNHHKLFFHNIKIWNSHRTFFWT